MQAGINKQQDITEMTMINTQYYYPADDEALEHAPSVIYHVVISASKLLQGAGSSNTTNR